MSRSVKKKPIIKDKPTSGKRIGSKKFRRKSKQKVKRIDEDTILPEDKSEVINDYDVSDFKFHVNKKNCNKVNKKGELRK